MAIPNDQIAKRFVDAVLDAAPVAGNYANLARLEHAGSELQRMAIGLNSHTAQGFALSEETFQGIVNLFFSHDFTANKERLTRFFGRHLLAEAQGIRNEGLAWLEQETGWTVDALQSFVRKEGKAHVASVFGSVGNLSTGIKHVFTVQEGLKGRNWGVALLAWGGLAAGFDALRRGIIGSSVAVEKDDGTMTTETQRQPGTAIAEGVLAGTAIASALKIAEDSMLRLK